MIYRPVQGRENLHDGRCSAEDIPGLPLLCLPSPSSHKQGQEQAPTIWYRLGLRQAGCGPLQGQPYIHLRYPECATRMHDMHGARTSREQACPFPSTSVAVKRARVSTACCQRQLVHRSPWLCIHAHIFFYTAILHMALQTYSSKTHHGMVSMHARRVQPKQ